MRNTLTGLATFLALAGCASTPKQPPAPPVTKTVTVDATNVVEVQHAGYQIVNKDGEKLYCRRDPVLGSLVRYTTTCLTEAELIRQQANNQAAMEHTQAVPQTKMGN